MLNFKSYRVPILIILFLLCWLGISTAYASGSTGEDDIIGRIDLLIIQVSLITFAAWAGGVVFKQWKLPPVLGEIIAGIVIGPYLLGGVPLWGFSQGLFPLNGDFPVSIELYSLATIASIILLFFVGLETDLDTFLQFSFAGSVIGICGALASFILGDYVGMLYMTHETGVQQSFFHPVCLFFGVISTATSVSITARILLEKRRMNSADGVTILSAAVIDDILGIVVLAIVIGMAQQHQLSAGQVLIIAGRTIGIWLFIMITGLIYSRHLSNFLRKSKDQTTITLMSFAIALLLAGILEKTGLAMIIGAYTIGLIFSKTDLAFLIQEKISMLERFFVPIFFCVMGMFIDPAVLFSSKVLMFGGLYIVLAVVGKFLGCCLPALFCNFNWLGASRIGIGMVPRGEVALIVAGVGISKGIIDHEVFSIAIVMTFFTTLVTPPILNRILKSDASVLRKNPPVNKDLIKIHFDMPNAETAEFFHNKILQEFGSEGFHCHRQYHGLYLIRKNITFISMRYSRHYINFECLKQDETFINVLFYEVIAELEWFMTNLQSYRDKYNVGKKIINGSRSVKGAVPRAFQHMSHCAVEADLKGQTKDEILSNLIHLFVQCGQLNMNQANEILEELKVREGAVSTGLQDGIALPHTKTEMVNELRYAVGVSKNGVNFGSLDGEKAQIFILSLIPEKKPEEHLQNVSELSKFLSDAENRHKIIAAENNNELLMILKGVI